MKGFELFVNYLTSNASRIVGEVFKSLLGIDLDLDSLLSGDPQRMFGAISSAFGVGLDNLEAVALEAAGHEKGVRNLFSFPFGNDTWSNTATARLGLEITTRPRGRTPKNTKKVPDTFLIPNSPGKENDTNQYRSYFSKSFVYRLSRATGNCKRYDRYNK